MFPLFERTQSFLPRYHAPTLISPVMPLSERAPADAPANTPTKASQSVDDAILEAWGQGFNVGSLVILILLVLCNYRRHVLLHKLILLEVRKGAANSVTISINGPPPC